MYDRKWHTDQKVTLACRRPGKKIHARKRNPHESRFARAPINASFLLATDRAAPEGFEIWERDPHGAGGTETRRGGKSGEAGAIPAESRDLRQIIAKIMRRARAAGSLESDRLELFRFNSDARSQLRDINIVNDRLHKVFKYDDWNRALSDC